MNHTKHTFKWPSIDASQVYLTGSFDNWGMKYPMVKNTELNCFTITLDIPIEKIYYKFVVDDNWFVSVNDKIEKDDLGNENNIIYLEDLDDEIDRVSEFTSISYPNSDHLKNKRNNIINDDDDDDDDGEDNGDGEDKNRVIVNKGDNVNHVAEEDLNSSIQITLKDNNSINTDGSINVNRKPSQIPIGGSTNSATNTKTILGRIRNLFK